MVRSQFHGLHLPPILYRRGLDMDDQEVSGVGADPALMPSAPSLASQSRPIGFDPGEALARATRRVVHELQLSAQVFHDYGLQHRDKAFSSDNVKEVEDRTRKAQRNFDREAACRAALHNYGLALAGIGDPLHAILGVDCTGDETLWVFRYASYFKSVTGCDLAEAIGYANEAWGAWGQDPDCTPEEIASSDIAELAA
jgi:hypothetical protein